MAERSCIQHHVFILICNAVMTEEVKPKAVKKPSAAAIKKSTTPEMTTAPVAAGKMVPVALDFNDPKTAKFINYIMKHGKRTVAQKIFLDTMKEIQVNGHPNPQAVLETALENASPDIMVKSKRIGGAVYQVPMEVKSNKKLFFATKWILDSAKSKKGKPMYKKLAEELLAAYSGQGPALKRKEEVHRMADANKAFAYLSKYVK
jgi:small subunit ribosomal protein S7